MLCSDLHQCFPRFRFGIGRLGSRRGGYLGGYNRLGESGCGDPAASDTHELPAIHSSPPFAASYNAAREIHFKRRGPRRQKLTRSESWIFRSPPPTPPPFVV